MKAKLILDIKKKDQQGNITEMVLWKLPAPSLDRPHGIKYRCYHGNASGQCIVRYDNETGKGDHKHIGDREIPYKFVSVEKLVRDFIDEINYLSRKENKL